MLCLLPGKVLWAPLLSPTSSSSQKYKSRPPHCGSPGISTSHNNHQQPLFFTSLQFDRRPTTASFNWHSPSHANPDSHFFCVCPNAWCVWECVRERVAWTGLTFLVVFTQCFISILHGHLSSFGSSSALSFTTSLVFTWLDHYSMCRLSVSGLDTMAVNYISRLLVKGL